jgi:hypothetical protein
MAPKYELCVGLNKGQKTTKIIQKQYKGDRKEKGIRQARKKNVSYTPNSLFKGENSENESYNHKIFFPTKTSLMMKL